MKHLAIITVLLLSACQFPPSRAEIEGADYGSAPMSVEGPIQGWMVPRLKDPDSAGWTFGTIEKGWSYVGDNLEFGWTVKFTVNARNSFGGFTGAKPYLAFFRDNQLRAIMRYCGGRTPWFRWMRIDE